MNFRKNLALWVIIALLIFTLFNLFQGNSNKGPHQNLAFSDFLGAIDSGDVRDVTIQGQKITGHYGDGRSFRTYSPNDPNLIPNLNHNHNLNPNPIEPQVP